MKKIISFLITLITVFNLCFTVSAKNNDYLYELASLNIIEGDENGDYMLEKTMTRAELVACVTRLLDYGELAGSLGKESQFEDVSPDAWYAEEVNLMASLNIIHGTSKTKFEPDLEVQREQVVKILVNILGYGQVAEHDGGYPDGYMKYGSNLGLLKNVKASPFNRESIFVMIHNALDVEILENWGNDQMSTYGNTLRGYLLREKSDGRLFESSGIVTANADTYLLSPDSDFEDDEIEIDGKIYKTGSLDASDLLGQEVEFYAKETEYGDNEIVSIRPTNDNTITIIDEENLISIQGSELRYFNDNERSRTLDLSSSCKVVKNGRILKQYSDADLVLSKGTIKAIDNNDDRNIDVLLIEDYRNVKVAEIIDDTIVLFGDDRLNGKKYIAIDPDEDDVRTVIYNTDGDRLSVQEIEANSIISAIVSKDGTFQKFIVSTNTASGNVNSISDEEICVDDVAYKMHKEDSFEFSLSDDVTLRFDYRGYVAYVDSIIENERYGYVVACGNERGLSDEFYLRMVIGSKIEMRYAKNEVNLDDTNLIPSIVCQNDDIDILETVPKLRVNGVRFKGDSVPTGLYKYTLNDEGKVTSLTSPIFAGGGNAMKYNVYDKTFGANNANEPIGIDEDTMVICLPKNAGASESDYLVPLEINDKVTSRTFDVYGYDYDITSKKVNIIVFEEIMDSSALPVVDPTSGTPLIGMVKETSIAINEDDELVQKLVLITNSGEQEHIIEEIEGKNSFFEDLRSGDLIYYAKDLNGVIANYKLICSFSNINREPFYKNQSAVDEQIFGYVTNVEYDEIDGARNILVNVVELMSEDVMSVDVRKRNAPPVFIYESRNNVTLGSFKDILPGGSGEYLFMLRPYSVDVRACVIVR